MDSQYIIKRCLINFVFMMMICSDHTSSAAGNSKTEVQLHYKYPEQEFKPQNRRKLLTNYNYIGRSIIYNKLVPEVMLKKRCMIEDGSNVVGGSKDAVGVINNVVGGVNIHLGGVKPPLASADREPEQKNESQNNPNQIGCPVGRTRHFCGHQPEEEEDDVFTCLPCDGTDLQSGNIKVPSLSSTGFEIRIDTACPYVF